MDMILFYLYDKKEEAGMRGICFQIKDILVETTLQKCLEDMGEVPYAIVLSPSTWMRYRDSFDMGFDIDPNPENIYNTKAEVNYDSITGTFSIPYRDDLGGDDAVFSFSSSDTCFFYATISFCHLVFTSLNILYYYLDLFFTFTY